MPKAYWIARIDVDDAEEYAKYVAASRAAFDEYGARALARGGRVQVLEGSGRGRNVVWEFPSFEAAIECYHSTVYQKARALRAGIATGEFIVVEGVQDV